MNYGKWVSVILFATTAVSLGSAPARAQDQDQDQDQDQATRQEAGVEEVVVSARRREEALKDVPISIVSRSGEYLEEARVESITELARVVPGFVFNEFEAGQQSTAQLRGLSSFAFQTHAPQSVGIVVDDVVLDVIGQGMNEFNDINHVEVLRGPQGTLFGRNTTGGVIHIVTNDPVDRFEAKLAASYGSYDEVKWNGMLNVPLSEQFATRISAFSSNRDGYIENIRDGRMLNSEEQAGVNAKLLFTPGENTRLQLGAIYMQRHREGTTSSVNGDPVVAFGPTATEEDILLNKDIAGPENNKVNGIGFHPFDEEIAALSLRWQQAIGDFALTSISSWRRWDFEYGANKPFHTFNSPIEPISTVNFYVPNDLGAWSQEVRLASPSGRRVEYVVGVFGSGTDLRELRDFLINISEDPDPAAAIFVFDLGDQHTHHLDYAAFGEADFHLTDTVTFTAGLRWTHDRTTVSLDGEPPPNFDPEAGIGIGPLGEIYIPFLDSAFPGHQRLKISESEWTWRTGLRFEPTDDLMFYTTVSRGFKGPTVTALGGLGPVQPEIAKSYEVGTKVELLDNRVATGLTVFYTDVDDLQSQGTSTIVTPRGDISEIFLTNAAQVRTRGAEFELSAFPTERMSLNLGAAYIDAEFVRYPNAGCYAGQLEAGTGCTAGSPNTQDLSGRKMPLVPKWSGNAALNYDFRLPLGGTSQFLRLDYTYRGRVNWDLGLSPMTESDAVGIWGLTLGIRSHDEKLELLASVKNLTDEFVVNDLSGGIGTISASLLPEYQRTWGVTVNYRFE